MTYVIAAPLTASIVWPTWIALPIAASGILATLALALVALRAARRRPRIAQHPRLVVVDGKPARIAA
jgi:hypothetical protein